MSEYIVIYVTATTMSSIRCNRRDVAMTITQNINAREGGNFAAFFHDPPLVGQSSTYSGELGIGVIG